MQYNVLTFRNKLLFNVNMKTQALSSQSFLTLQVTTVAQTTCYG